MEGFSLSPLGIMVIRHGDMCGRVSWGFDCTPRRKTIGPGLWRSTIRDYLTSLAMGGIGLVGLLQGFGLGDG